MMRSPLHNENLSFVMNEGFFNAKCFSFFCIRVEPLVQGLKGMTLSYVYFTDGNCGSITELIWPEHVQFTFTGEITD